MTISPLLQTDVYKTVHHEQYPEDTSHLVSYLIPRKSRTDEDYLIMFGLQYYIKKFLIDDWKKNFFDLPFEEAIRPYSYAMRCLLGSRFVDRTDLERFKELHKLGYLPLNIRALPEGTKVPIHVPMIEITNTDSDFAWLVNYIETSMQCTLWHMMASANIGYRFRQIVHKWYDKTVCGVPEKTAICDFSMRGQESMESAAASSAAYLLSFDKTATIPAFWLLDEYYTANPRTSCTGLASTEHSVMCSNFAVDHNERSMILRLLKEIYPNDNFSMVSDSYDYWNLVCNILRDPEVKQAVLEHKGFIGIRGDSGDPVDIVAGKLNPDPDQESDLGTVEVLWNIFGGTVNEKGYKVLDPHIKAVYGDGITTERAEEIYRRLEAKGFAANNVSLGMGAYSMQSVNGKEPLTRDTYGIAVKSTSCTISYQEYPIYKDPKTDDHEMKKSPKGMCLVYYDENGNLTYKDNQYQVDIDKAWDDDEMWNIFYNGNFLTTWTLDEIRDRLWEGHFDD